MEQHDKLSIVEDIEVEYKKFYNECKKKHTEVHSLIDQGLNTLAHLKTLNMSQIDIELKQSIDSLLSPIILASKQQIRKLYVSSLAIIKKLVSYRLIKQKNSNEIINVLKDILTNSNEEFVQIKVIETLLPMVDRDIVQLSQNLVTNVMTMCLKFYSLKSNVFKNPLSALLKQLTTTVFGFLFDTLQPVVDKEIKKIEKGRTQQKIEDDNKENKEEQKEEQGQEQQQEQQYEEQQQDQQQEQDQQEQQVEEQNNESQINKDENSENINENQDTKQEEQEKEEEKKEVEEKNAEEGNKIEINAQLKKGEEILVDLTEYEDLEVYTTSLYLFNLICDLCEGKKVQLVSTSIHSKCLGYELLSSTLGTTQSLIKHMPEFSKRIKESLLPALAKGFSSSYDYLSIVKLTRLTLRLLKYLNVGAELIQNLVALAETSNATWQKQIGIEFLCEAFSVESLLVFLYVNHSDIYENLLSTLSKISYASALNKKLIDITNLSFDKTLQNRLILNENIFIDEAIPNTNHSIIYTLLIQAFNELRTSYKNLIDNTKITKIVLVKLISFKQEQMINSLFALAGCCNEDKYIDKFMTLFVDFINIFGGVKLNEIRDKYLTELNNLITEGPLSDKVMFTIFRLFDNVHVHDEKSFVLILNALHKIYIKLISTNLNLVIKPSDDMEVESYIKYVQGNLDKFAEQGEFEHILNAPSQETPDPTQSQKLQPQEEEKEKENETSPNPQEGATATPTATPTPTSTPTPKQVQTPKEESTGLFSKLKYAFGFRSSASESTITVDPAVEKEKYQKLSESIESLFISKSPYFSDEVIVEISSALVLSNKAQIEDRSDLRTHKIHFNLMKLLELLIANCSRFTLIYEKFKESVIEIASAQITVASHFSIDIMTIGAMYLLNKITDEKDIQEKIFEPLCIIAQKNVSQDINLNIIYDITILLSNTSLKLNYEGWNSIFKIFAYEIKGQNEAQTENCFVLIEDIFKGRTDRMTPENFVPLMQLLELFVSYKKNENISKESLTLIDSLTGICEDYNRQIYDGEVSDDVLDAKKKFFDDIWKNIFKVYDNVSCDERSEIRNLSIKAFNDIFVSRSGNISPEVGLVIINEDFIKVLERTYTIFEEKLKYNRKMQQIKTQHEKEETKKNEEESNFKFGAFRVDQLKLPTKPKKTIEVNIIKPSLEEIEWEVTLGEILKGLSTEISTYIKTNSNLGYEFYRQNIFPEVASKYSSIMKYTSPKIIIQVLESLLVICDSDPNLFGKNMDMIWNVYDEMARFIQSDYFIEIFPQMSKDSGMVHNIIKHISSMFFKEETNSMSDDDFKHIILIIRSMISSCSNNEGSVIIDTPYKLLYDESNVFDFCGEMQKKIINNEPALYTYMNYLSENVEIDLNNLHTEALSRKSLEMFAKLFTNKNLSLEVAKTCIPNFIELSQYIICLRNKPEFVTSLLRENTKEALWHYGSSNMIKVLRYIITTNNRKKININSIWESLIKSYEYIFKQNQCANKIPNKILSERLIRSNQEMEIEIIDFIVNGLLPNSLYIPREMQIKLLNLLDMGSNFEYSSNSSSNNNTVSSSISKICISNLFELCKYKTDEMLRKEVVDFDPEEYIEIKVKIAKMTTPILIKRCKETLKKFLDDEIKSGSMPLSRTRFEDIKFVLEKLKDLDVYPNYNIVDNEEIGEPKTMMDFILMKQKSHLISLLPLLSEFITTKENEIKIIVKDIFRIISNEIGVK